jgi:group I intron endonuclease
MIHFVYITTNLINKKQYIGDHSTNNLNDGYLGSGLLINKALKKYNKKNFKRKILEFFSSKEEAFYSQEKYIKKYDTLTPNGYNISPTGGHNVKGCISEETKQKISESNKGKHFYSGMYGKNLSKEAKEKISKFRKGRKLTEKHKINISKGNKGRKHSEETKNKIRIGNLGKKPSEETREKMSKSQKGNTNCVGRKLSLETREKISKSKKGQIPWNKDKKIKIKI